MALIQINHHPARRELRVFAAILLPLFCVIVAAVMWRAGAGNWAFAPLAVAAASLAVGLTSPQAARPVYLGWVYAAYPIGWTVSQILMLATYFLVVTPIGLMMRLCRYDPMTRKKDPERESYWEPREVSRDPSSYFRQF